MRPTISIYSIVVMKDNCWVYAGYTVKGYAALTVRDQGRYWRVYVHRLIYEQTVGPIPGGKVLDHLCRVTQCINPDHLEPVSNKTNLLRGVGVGAINAAKTHCAAGHEFNEANTHIDKAGKRKCRVCNRLRSARDYALRKSHAKSAQANIKGRQDYAHRSTAH